MSGSNIHFEELGYTTQTFTVNGTFNVPEGVDIVHIEMYGGGGAGDNSTFLGSNISNTGFGGEAGDRITIAVPVTGGAAIAVVIGAGGIIANGVATTFGALISAGGLMGGNMISDVAGLSTYNENGAGRGRGNLRGVGGTSSVVANKVSFGGDAGHGNGGNSGGGNGGLGAGGGSGGGNGGAGICIVTYKVP